MKKRRTMNKQRRATFHASSVIAITLCIITMGLLIATCLNTYFVNRQQEKNIRDINKLMMQISSNVEVSNEETLEDIYLAYYNDIDQKATDSINVALSFFGFIFSLITIVNTIISVRIPKQFENSLSEIDDRIKEVERSARESTNSARYVNSVSSKKTIREKIDAITAVIEDYGDNSGEFYFARGFLYDDIKDYDSAKADYARAKKAGGLEYTYHNSMGVLYSNIMSSAANVKDKKSAFRKSEQHYKKAITLLEKIDENSDYCHCNLACLYQDYAKTLKGWSTIERINSETFSEGEYSQAFQKYSKLALEEFNKTITISDDYLTAYYNRGISYREMGENNYKNAYDDFRMCYELDPENKDVLEMLFKTALALFQKTNQKEYYDIAKVCIKKLREDIDEIELLSQKFNAIEEPNSSADKFDSNILLAKIDEKIADLSVEEANEHTDDLADYGNRISDAIEHYNSALEMYKQLYATSKNNEYWNAIERLRNKIADIQKPD